MIEPNHDVLTGLDVLEQENFAPLKGKKVGLITNQTGIDRAGRRNIDAMIAAGVKLTTLFSPEHGIDGKEDLPRRRRFEGPRHRPAGLEPELQRPQSHDPGNVARRRHPGLRHSGRRRAILYLLLHHALRSRGIREIASADLYSRSPQSRYRRTRRRPASRGRPICRAFVGCYAMPIRHGLTFGELATMANAERKLHSDLHVVKIEKLVARRWWFDSTGLNWIDPSPNMRSLNAATLYEGLAMLESARNYSVGRGTDSPFEQIGVPIGFMARSFARALNARQIPGVRVYPTRFQPDSSNFKGKLIEGARFVVINREQFSSVRLGLEIAYALEKLYPGKIDFETCRSLIGNRAVIDALKKGDDPRSIEQNLEPSIESFLDRRKPFLLY